MMTKFEMDLRDQLVQAYELLKDAVDKAEMIDGTLADEVRDVRKRLAMVLNANYR